MNKSILIIGIFAMIVAVSPAFATETQTDQFKALEGVSDSAPMSDAELATIEGQAPPFLTSGQVGLVNVNAQVAVGAVRVIRDITIQDVNVQVLGSGNQR